MPFWTEVWAIVVALLIVDIIKAAIARLRS